MIARSREGSTRLDLKSFHITSAGEKARSALDTPGASPMVRGFPLRSRMGY